MISNYEQPLVSLILTNYNSIEYIEKCLKSIFNQTFKNLELIIIDDASDDGSFELINQTISKNYNAKLLRNKINQGYLKSFNKALNESTGDYICFLDSDDFIAFDKIEKQVNFLQKNSEIACVGTSYSKFFNDAVYDTIIYPDTDYKIKKFLQDEISVCFCGSSVMITKLVKETIGGYRDFFDRCPSEDFDWLRRISNQFKVANLKDALYFYRLNPFSLSRAIPTNSKAAFSDYYAKFFDEQRLTYSGKDSITNEEIAYQLDIFKSYIDDKYDKEKKYFLKKKIFNHVILGQYKNSFDLLSQAFKIYNFMYYVLILTFILFYRISPHSIKLKILGFINKRKTNNRDNSYIKNIIVNFHHQIN